MLNCIVGPFLSERKPLVCSGFISRSRARVNGPPSTAAQERRHAGGRALRSRWPKKLLRDERARAGAESGARPGAGADVEEVPDRRAVARLRGERTPEE